MPPKRLREMLVQAVPHLVLPGTEDHHALLDLQLKLNCTPKESLQLLRLAIKEFPHLKVINTGAL